ncbi:DUF932 domain-containing protein [Alloalcanivorax gelatiniphagus]|uniref:DUF945 domain-containing protein n=1 Tax=Alloalcanivorax gelatiniphagus TaxID=1194167 RepID=A0ABY2XN38_9GAMM|nr:DUF932 domain-containing protein [Alloalcanivorax marinus]TMW13787.1 DUF945 domain-containing protein [Alloalcanivorax gelatiniphagus]
MEKFLIGLFQERPLSKRTTANERAMAKVHALFHGAGRGADLPSAKGTVYGLLNAVTEFVDHERRARSFYHRLDSA